MKSLDFYCNCSIFDAVIVTARTKCRVICFVDCTIKDTKLRKEKEEEKKKEREL
jgi:hypothetical protein